MTQDRIAVAISDSEFAAMMKEFDAAGAWMREQVALKRAASSPDALKQSSANVEGQVAARNRNAIDDHDGDGKAGGAR